MSLNISNESKNNSQPDFISAGSHNDYGFLNGLDRMGLTCVQALSELYANSIDEKCENIRTIVNESDILIIDDGHGMTQEKLKYMWDSRRENHITDESIGVSGIGATAATKLLSRNTLVNVFTKHKDEPYCKSIVPWDEMISKKTYVGMIKIGLMTDTEIKMFKTYLNDSTGTIIQFKYNDFMVDELNKQYIDQKKIANPNERFDCIFAKFDQVSFRYTNNPNSCESIKLKMYKPFDREKKNYYQGVTEHIVTVFECKGNKIYALDTENGYISCKRHANGFRKEPVPFKKINGQHKLIGSFNIYTLVQSNNKYFDPSDPKIPTADKHLTKYEKEFFTDTDNVKEFLSKPVLCRNGHNIGIIKLESFKYSSSRADGKSCLKLFYVRTEVNYTTISSQTNILDNIFNIQENKNQLNSTGISKQIIRLIEYCIKLKYEQVWKYFEDEVEKKKINSIVNPPVPVPVIPPVPVPVNPVPINHIITEQMRHVLNSSNDVSLSEESESEESESKEQREENENICVKKIIESIIDVKERFEEVDQNRILSNGDIILQKINDINILFFQNTK